MAPIMGPHRPHADSMYFRAMRYLPGTWGLVVLLLHAWSSDGSRYLDIFISGLPNRILPNVSLGLDHDLNGQGHQCTANGSRRFSHDGFKMGYTPNRRLQAQTVVLAREQLIQIGFVLALGAHSNQYYDYGPGGSLNGIMAVWDSWVDNFFSRASNTSSLVLLFDERDFLRQNDTKVAAEYIDSIVMRNMGASPVDCVQSHRGSGGIQNVQRFQAGGHGSHGGKRHAGARKAPHGCKNELLLDQGYRVYYLDVASSTNPEQLPFIIFAGIHRFPIPDWAKGQDEETLFIHWRPSRIGRFKTNYGYVKMTNWYSYHMLNLRILDYFDYGGKLDNDVSFISPFPEPNLPLRMAARGSKMISSERGWYCDDWRIAQGCKQALSSWIDLEKQRCGDAKMQMVPGGRDTVLFEGNFNLTIRSHFITYWLGLYDAPETKALAEHWNNFHPRGMWDYRWGDQQWWTRPIAMYGDGNVDRDIEHYYELNSTDGDGGAFVQHKLWPLALTVGQTQYFNLSGSTRQVRRANYEATIRRECKKNKYVQCI